MAIPHIYTYAVYSEIPLMIFVNSNELASSLRFQIAISLARRFTQMRGPEELSSLVDLEGQDVEQSMVAFREWFERGMAEGERKLYTHPAFVIVNEWARRSLFVRMFAGSQEEYDDSLQFCRDRMIEVESSTHQLRNKSQ